MCNAPLRLYSWDWHGDGPWVTTEEPDIEAVADWFEKGTVRRNWTTPNIYPMHRGKYSQHSKRLRMWDQPVPQYEKVRTISERAKAIVGPFLEGVADVLSFAPSEHGQFHAVHVHRVIDCFDTPNSEHETMQSTGGLGHIFRWAFKEALLPRDDKVFRIPERYWPIVSQPFVDAVKAADLKGFRFHLLWDESLENQPDQRDNTWAQ